MRLSDPLQQRQLTVLLRHQVWDTENPEQVTELLSLRDGRCAAATMLPAPTRKQDGFSTARPLLMLVDDDLAADPPVRVLSLHTGRPLKKGLDVAAPVLDVKANEEVVAVIGREEVSLRFPGPPSAAHRASGPRMFVPWCWT